ncbi:MAG: transketolase [Bacteroidetes bacterium]|nr:MAG: transketolase [Bacteroidota bacterium]
MLSATDLSTIASQVRRDIIRMVHGAASGHPGGSLGATDFLVALYFAIMKPDPNKFSMDGNDEDIFFLSNGHISPAWYSVLARYGYIKTAELETFRKLNSRLQGHPSPMDGVPGIRMASGSLGQGLSVALGAALSKKLNGDPRTVYCLVGDGELQEGQNWEALLFGAARGIDNIIAVVDYNRKQIDGPLDEVLSLGDLRAKLESFGWIVQEMDGNDITDILDQMSVAKQQLKKGKPVIMIMHTHMGCGVDFMLDSHEWHGVPPNSEEADRALLQLEETMGDY